MPDADERDTVPDELLRLVLTDDVELVLRDEVLLRLTVDVAAREVALLLREVVTLTVLPREVVALVAAPREVVTVAALRDEPAF